MPTLSPMMILHGVIMTTCCATSDNKVGIMETLGFRGITVLPVKHILGQQRCHLGKTIHTATVDSPIAIPHR